MTRRPNPRFLQYRMQGSSKVSTTCSTDDKKGDLTEMGNIVRENLRLAYRKGNFEEIVHHDFGVVSPDIIEEV